MSSPDAVKICYSRANVKLYSCVAQGRGHCKAPAPGTLSGAMAMTKSEFSVVINRESGYVAEHSLESVTDLVESRLDKPPVSLFAPEPQGVDAALRDAFGDVSDAVIVIGGDGTQRRAAELSCQTGKPFMPLPGGTMNVLPRRVYGDRDLVSILSGRLGEQERRLDAGLVNDRLFLISAAFGAITDLAMAREQVRGSAFFETLPDAIRRAGRGFAGFGRENVRYAHDGMGEPRGASSLIISVGPLSQIFNPSEAVDDRVYLEYAALKLGDLSGLPRFASQPLRRLLSERRQAVSGDDAEFRIVLKSDDPRVVLDGEPMRAGREIRVRIKPGAVRILASD